MLRAEENIKKYKSSVIFVPLFFVFLIGAFLFGDVYFAHAGILDAYESGWRFFGGSVEGSKAIKESTPSISGWIADQFLLALKYVLYGIFVFFGWIASLAVTIFGWIINPVFIGGGGLLDKKAVYDMWKFVRDFFNLFFILVLLYIAFTIVFQVTKDYKKAILNLVIMALLVNFSFPISRFLIDATNVPMYFFVNQMLVDSNNPGESLGTVLKVSKISGILLPPIETEKYQVSQLIAAIVFMFLFSITLLVLALMLLIRLVMLVILVIFSSAGFAGMIVPGMESLGKKWWTNFWNYALYGPAAMLLLLISVRFFGEISQDATFQSVAGVAGVNTMSGYVYFISSMAMFSIPIVMLWITIGLANSMSVAGSGMVVGQGQKFAKWAGGKTWGGAKWAALHNPLSNTVRGAGQGAKERYNDTRFAKWTKSPSWFEAGAKGAVTGKGWKGGAAAAQSKHQEKLVNEKIEEHKKNKTSASALEKNLQSGDIVERKAAALALADSKDITSPERLRLALAAVTDDMDRYAKVLQSADGKAMGMSADQMQEAIAERDEKGMIKKDDSGNVIVNDKAYKAVTSKMKKEGRVDVVVDYRVKKGGEKQGDVIRDTIDKMTAEEISKQADLIKHSAYGTDTRIEIGSLMTSDPQRYQEIKKRATGEISKLI